VKAVHDWLAARADTALGRLAVNWFRAYFDASRNSGCAVTLYSSLSVLPAALVGLAYFHLSAADANVFADRIVDHLRLHGSSAALVHTTFGGASSNVLAATIAAVLGFLLWGIGIGPLYRDVYARAWHIEIEGSALDQLRYTIFFFVASAVVGLGIASASVLRSYGWLWVVTAWIVGSLTFWLWVPLFLLRRRVSASALLPGALLACIVLGGAIAFAPLYVAPVVNQNGKAFGSFGVVLSLLGYFFILVTLSLVCSVFAPVWRDWRRSERERGRAE
jgi:hypothetical protein